MSINTEPDELLEEALSAPIKSPANPPPESQAPIKRNGNERGLWPVLGCVGGAGLAFLTHALLTRLLTRHEYGQYVLILSAVTFLSIVARCGLNRTLVRFIAEGFAIGDRGRVKTAIRLGFFTLVGSLTVCLVVAPPLLYVLGSWFDTVPSRPQTVAVILAAVFVASVMQFIAEIFRGMHDLKHAALFDGQSSKPLSNGLYLAAIAVAGYFLGALTAAPNRDALGATSAMAMQIIVMGGMCAVGAYHLRGALGRIKTLRPVEGHHELVPLTEGLFLATCLPLLVTEILGFCANQGDVWIVGAVLTEDKVALFGAARRFIQATSMPLMAINLMVLPSIPQMHVQRRTADLQRLLQRNATAAFIPSVILLIIAMCGPGIILSTLYGPGYSGAGNCLVILCVGQVFHMFTGNCGQLLMLTGRQRVVLGVYLLAAVLLFTLGPPVVYRFGINGFALLSASILVLENVIIWLAARRLVGVWTHASPAHLTDALRHIKNVLARGRGPHEATARVATINPNAEA